jgi:hypothetical protein
MPKADELAYDDFLFRSPPWLRLLAQRIIVAPKSRYLPLLGQTGGPPLPAWVAETISGDSVVGSDTW